MKPGEVIDLSKPRPWPIQLDTVVICVATVGLHISADAPDFATTTSLICSVLCVALDVARWALWPRAHPPERVRVEAIAGPALFVRPLDPAPGEGGRWIRRPGRR